MRYPFVFLVALVLFVTAAIILTSFIFKNNDIETTLPAPAITTTHSLPSHQQILPTGQPSTPPFVNATTASPTKPPHKTVLFWGTYFERSWQHVPDEITCSEIYSCSLTTNVDKYYLNSDAVLYHGRSVVSNVAPLDKRPRGQIWIYYNQEAPPHMGSFTGTPNIINWTLTYISSADVHHYYGGIRPGKFQGGFDPTKNYLEGKTKTAAAMISNCVGHRMEYISKISKYIDIEVYGGCGHQQVCKDCWNTLKPYKFYLAFENNYCKDYITEKFYRNALLHGMVPVTINGADLTNPKVAPPGSYIDATKFSSAEQLADFLRTEGSDPEHYNKYFRWYSTHDVVDGTDYSFYCDLCEAVHHAEKKQNMYKDVVAWYRKAGECSTYPSIS